MFLGLFKIKSETGLYVVLRDKVFAIAQPFHVCIRTTGQRESERNARLSSLLGGRDV